MIVNALNHYMDALERRGYFHGSVLVSYKGNVLISKGYGYANFEHRVPNTSNTKYRIGSLTKAFTAMAVLLLQEQGLLHVGDPISKFLPDYPNGDNITIHQLLNHTAGVPNFTSVPEYWNHIMRLPTTPEKLIATISEMTNDFTPGQGFSYSNSGFILLGGIIERASGLNYGTFLQRHILEPLGMNDTGLDNGKTVHRHMASGYSVWEEAIHAEWVDMSVPYSAYGLYSTVEDLFKWDRALYSNHFVSDSLLEAMFNVYSHHYGYGWAVHDVLIHGSQRRCLSHFGDINGFGSDFLRFPDEELTVIVCSNIHLTPVTKISRILAAIALGEPIEPIEQIMPLEHGMQHVMDFVGVYEIEDAPEKTIEITAEAGRLYISMPKMYGVTYKYKLIPVSLQEKQAAFVTQFVDEKVNLAVSSDGATVEMRFEDLYGVKTTAVLKTLQETIDK